MIVGEAGRYDNDETEHDSEVKIRLVLFTLLDTDRNVAQQCSGPKHIIEETSHVKQKFDVPRKTFLLREGIEPILKLKVFGLIFTKSKVCRIFGASLNHSV